MKTDTINQISIIINRAINYSISNSNLKEKLNSLLAHKTPSEALSYLNSNCYENGQQKNKAVVIVALGYLYLNADLKDEIKDAIIENKLEKNYYGGIKTLILGKSDTFKIDINIDDKRFENRFTYINRFEPNIIMFFQIFYALEILNEISQSDFEKILIEEKALYFLISACQHFLCFNPTNEFLKKLLNSSNETQRNIAFCYIISPIRNYICGEHRDNINEEELEKLLTDFYKVFDCADKKYVVSLLFNYILIESRYPKDFVYRISQKEFVKDLCFEINQSNKIKFIRELYNVVSNINYYNALENSDITNAILDCFKSLFEESYFYHEYEKNNKELTEMLIKILPRDVQLSLKEYFTDYDNKLMISELDKLVRNKIYITDIKKHNCITQIINCIN